MRDDSVSFQEFDDTIIILSDNNNPDGSEMDVTMDGLTFQQARVVMMMIYISFYHLYC